MSVREVPIKLQGRYELRDVLGHGGMGVVYRAFDNTMNREVAVKTLLDIRSPEALAQFFKEWNILASMVHPNIVSIYDIGDFNSGNSKRPFFVMPLLPGVTLDTLIKEGSPRLTVKTILDIIDQTSRGLQAAHELGLIHRDVKPSNIFVMDDNSVKVIDFGIAREASANSNTSLKGTLFYLAPEQLEMKPPSPLWDQFSLGVVTYEALTRRRPFTGATDDEVAQSIRRLSPPPVSELNHEVSVAISQVIHKAIAKQPWHRFSNIKEYGEALHKAMRNEPLDYFDREKIKSRLDRASKSFEEGDIAFASEVVAELEGEGHLDQDITLLRGRLDQAVRSSRIQQLLESARRCFDALEYSLALRKIQDVLDLDAQDADALVLKNQIEKARREKKIEEWIGLVHQHLGNQAFRQAREAIESILQLKPNDTEALSLQAEVGRLEAEASQVREEKSGLYQSAVQAWEHGEITSALSRLDLLMRLDREHPDATQSSRYQNLYNQVHSEHDTIKNAYEDARRSLATENFESALITCKQYLTKYPNHALFQSLKFDVEQRQRQALSAAIAEADRRVEAEPDVDRRVGILQEALKTYPNEPHFEAGMRLVREKRDLVNSIVAKARFLEERAQFVEALDQWQILRSIHEQQPGLSFEIERLGQRRDQQAHQSAKGRWVELADKHLESGDYARAQNAVANGLVEFPGEPELLELSKLVQKSLERERRAQDLLRAAREKSDEESLESCSTILREAHQVDPRSPVIRTVLINSLLNRALGAVDKDHEFADRLVQEILNLDPQHAAARSLASRIADRRRDDFVAWCLSQARRLQAERDLSGAVAVVSQGLGVYPTEARLLQLQATLGRVQSEKNTQPPPASPSGLVLAPGSEMSAMLPPAASSNLPPVPEILITPSPSMPPEAPSVIAYRVSGAKLRNSVLYGGVAIFLLTSVLGVALYKEHTRIEMPPSHAILRESIPEIHREPDVLVPMPVPLPAPASLKIKMDLAGGSISIDGAPAIEIHRGEPQDFPLKSGQHTVSFTGGPSRLSFSVVTDGSSMPEVKGSLDAKLVRAFLLTRSGTNVELRTNKDGGHASLDGAPPVPVRNGILKLESVKPGPHELRLTGPLAGESNKIGFDDSLVNGAMLSLFPDANQGLLTVVTSEPGVKITINGKTANPVIQNGMALLFLPPRKYAIGVEKPGFETVPSQSADVQADRDSKLEFKLIAKKPPSLPVIAKAPSPPVANSIPSASVVPAPASPPPHVEIPALRTTPPSPGFGLEDWLKIGWIRNDGYVVREGGNFVLAPFESKGRLTFTVLLMRGKRIEWLLNYHDDKNYQMFSLEDQEFQHVDVYEGKKARTKVPFLFDRKSPITISIVSTSKEIVHRTRRNQDWIFLEGWKVPPGRDGGRFGFHIPNRDTLGLSEFQVSIQ